MQYYTAISLFFWYLIPLCKPYLTLLLNDPCTESPSFDASLDLCLASIFAFLMALFFSRELSWADELIAAISAATTSAALYKVITPWFYEPFLYSNILECFVEFFLYAITYTYTYTWVFTVHTSNDFCFVKDFTLVSGGLINRSSSSNSLSIPTSIPGAISKPSRFLSSFCCLFNLSFGSRP